MSAMRDYSKVPVDMWTGKNGKALRQCEPAVKVLAFYLLTGPHSNMIGMYYLPLPTLCHETGLTPQQASESLEALEKIGFAFYDAECEVVWVCDAARCELGDLKPKDKRIIAANKLWQSFRDCRFFEAFYERYGAVLQLSREAREAGSRIDAGQMIGSWGLE